MTEAMASSTDPIGVKCGLSEEVLSKYPRMFIIKKHREIQRNIRDQLGRTRFMSSFAFTAPLEQCAPAIPFGLKSICIKDMKEEKIYKGTYIEGTLVEEPVFINSIGMVFEDNNGDIERLCIYGLPHNAETQKLLCYGTKIRVLNPYFRMAMDGITVIRVDDPTSLQFVGKETDLCRYCRKGNATSRCARCQSSYAIYCNKECQKQDWKLMKHKLICSKH